MKELDCEQCGNKIKTGGFFSVEPYKIEKLCKNCFEEKFGKFIDMSTSARYHGGQKDWLAGGTFSDKDTGWLILTERNLIFKELVKGEIRIPFDKVLVSGWSTKEDSRLKGFWGGGAGLIGGGFGAGGMGGFLTETGKAHQIVLPYVDGNEIEQAPRFSVGWGQTKKWAKQIYDAIVEYRKKHGEIKESEKEVPEEVAEDPLNILKTRFAKGEITEEEFERKKKLLEE